MSVEPARPDARPGPALAVLIEPAPYMVAMTAALAARWPAGLTVRYVSAAATQIWANAAPETALPARRLSALVTLWREIRRTRPEVIFVAGWAHLPVLAAIVLGKLSGARIIALSDTWISPARGMRARLKRRILAMIDGFSPAGQRAAEFLRDQGVPPEKIVAGRMSSDTAAIARHVRTLGPEGRQEMRARLGVAPDAPVLMFLGRLAPEKGLDLLLDAFAQLANAEARLIVAGDGPLGETLAKAAARDPRILWRGRLEGAALRDHLAAADCLVLPSRAEPFGLVIGEALAAGCGVVASGACGAAPDLLGGREAGLIVPPGELPSLHAALARICADPYLRARMRADAPAAIAGWSSADWASLLCTLAERVTQDAPETAREASAAPAPNRKAERA